MRTRKLLERIDRRLDHGDELMAQIDRTLERHTEAFERHRAASDRHREAFERQAEAFERQAEAFERQAEAFERHGEAVTDLRQFMRDERTRLDRILSPLIDAIRDLTREIHGLRRDSDGFPPEAHSG